MEGQRQTGKSIGAREIAQKMEKGINQGMHF